jgi:hypothetical protein
VLCALCTLCELRVCVCALCELWVCILCTLCVSFYENLDHVRQTIIHVIPFYDDDRDNVTFAVVTQDVLNADGQQALILFSNGEIRVFAPLDYERGVRAFFMVIDMTDTGSLGTLPPLTTRFRLDFVLLGGSQLPSSPSCATT